MVVMVIVIMMDLLVPTTTTTTTNNILITTTTLHTLKYGALGNGGNSGFGWVFDVGGGDGKILLVIVA